MSEPSIAHEIEGAGAPGIEITPEMIPERALLEAAHRLSIQAGVSVPLEDYAEAACLLFSELSKSGWRVVPSDGTNQHAHG